MESLTYSFSLLSETFAHGAYQTMNFNRPELRAPSVKGMIRWWHQALGYTTADAHSIFGHVADRRSRIEGNNASRLIIRVQPLAEVREQTAEFMPHKKARGRMKESIAPGASYQLMVTQRRQQLSADLWNQVQRASTAWLLMGGIGQRSNRAAGSPWPLTDAPETPQAYLSTCRSILEGSQVRVALLEFSTDSPKAIRDLCGRFPNTRDYDIPGNVFGTAGDFKNRVPRKPSPLKLRAVHLNDSLHIAAIWAPSNPHEDTIQNLQSGIDTMLQIVEKRQLGTLLQGVLPSLAS